MHSSGGVFCHHVCASEEGSNEETSKPANLTSRSHQNTCMKKGWCWRLSNHQQLLMRWCSTLLVGSTVLERSQWGFQIKYKAKVMNPCGYWRAGLQTSFCKLKNFVVLIVLQLGIVLFHLSEPLCIISWRRHPSLFPPQNWSLPQLSRVP